MRPGVVFRVDWPQDGDTWYYPANALPLSESVRCASREQAEALAEYLNDDLERRNPESIAWYGVAVNVHDPEEVVVILACEYDGYHWVYERAFDRSRYQRPDRLRMPSRRAMSTTR